jgi:hypothetical protein
VWWWEDDTVGVCVPLALCFNLSDHARVQRRKGTLQHGLYRRSCVTQPCEHPGHSYQCCLLKLPTTLRLRFRKLLSKKAWLTAVAKRSECAQTSRQSR